MKHILLGLLITLSYYVSAGETSREKNNEDNFSKFKHEIFEKYKSVKKRVFTQQKNTNNELKDIEDLLKITERNINLYNKTTVLILTKLDDNMLSMDDIRDILFHLEYFEEYVITSSAEVEVSLVTD